MFTNKKLNLPKNDKGKCEHINVLSVPIELCSALFVGKHKQHTIQSNASDVHCTVVDLLMIDTANHINYLQSIPFIFHINFNLRWNRSHTQILALFNFEWSAIDECDQLCEKSPQNCEEKYRKHIACIAGNAAFARILHDMWCQHHFALLLILLTFKWKIYLQ